MPTRNAFAAHHSIRVLLPNPNSILLDSARVYVAFLIVAFARRIRGSRVSTSSESDIALPALEHATLLPRDIELIHITVTARCPCVSIRYTGLAEAATEHRSAASAILGFLARASSVNIRYLRPTKSADERRLDRPRGEAGNSMRYGKCGRG